jgi:ureidoglycolate lyase
MRSEPLQANAYRPYGDVVAARADTPSRRANLGFARRFDRLAALENRRPGRATPNVCVFRCQPMLAAAATRFAVTLLERHAHSTQMFVPMQGVAAYLVIVCLGGDRPDLATLRAFIATGAQGITYRPGVWHHPLVAMDQAGDFTCLVFEDESAGDCDVERLATSVAVDVQR